MNFTIAITMLETIFMNLRDDIFAVHLVGGINSLRLFIWASAWGFARKNIEIKRVIKTVLKCAKNLCANPKNIKEKRILVIRLSAPFQMKTMLNLSML